MRRRAQQRQGRREACGSEPTAARREGGREEKAHTRWHLSNARCTAAVRLTSAATPAETGSYAARAAGPSAPPASCCAAAEEEEEEEEGGACSPATRRSVSAAILRTSCSDVRKSASIAAT